MSKKNQQVKDAEDKPRMSQEEKRLRYVNLTNFRMAKVLKYLDMIARTTGNKFYPVYDSDVEKIVQAVNGKLEGVNSAFLSRIATKTETPSKVLEE